MPEGAIRRTPQEVEGDSVQLAIQATAASGGSIVFGAASLPPGLSINPNTGVIGGTVANTASSVYLVTVFASVGSDLQSAQFYWSVLAAGVVNQLTLANPGNQSNQEGQTREVDFSFTNSLGLPLDFTAQGLPPGVLLYPNPYNAYLYGQIQSGARVASPYHVTFTVTDGATTC
jgi:hypothetical protein